MAMSDADIINHISEKTGVIYSEEQRKILEHRGGLCILACAGSGKALADGTSVLTTTGYKNIEDLIAGQDICYDENGCEQEIVGVYPQGKKQNWIVVFDDGKVVDCCEDHLWAYKTDETAKEWAIGTTQEIYKLMINDGSRMDLEVFIPMPKPIKTVNNTEFFLQEIKDTFLRDLIKRVIELDFNSLKGIRDRELFLEHLFRKEKIKLHDGIYLWVEQEFMAFMELLLGSLGITYQLIATKNYKNAEIIKLLGEKQGNSILSGYVNVRTKSVITNIVKTQEQLDMTCIKVSGESGLFLMENFIVTHNTTILTHLLAKRIMSGEIMDVSRLLCTTYSKAGSLEMEERLNSLFQTLGIRERVSVKTLHASYYMVLRHFGYLKKVISNGQRSLFINQAIREAGLKLEDEDVQLVDSLLSFQINNLLTDEQLVSSYVYTLEDVPIEAYEKIRVGYNMKKHAESLVDFDDMQMFMYYLIVGQKDQDVLNYCRALWEYFYIDEFQDVSKIQFAILRALLNNGSKLVVIGDDDQAIYEWRGADPEIILNIEGYYDVKKFILSTNYRCAGNIVKLAAVGIKNNNRREEKDMIPFNEEGQIKMIDCGVGNLYNASRYAYTYIVDLIDNKGVNPEDIAVLCRNNIHGSVLNNMLFRRSIYTRFPIDMALTKNYVYRDLKHILTIGENMYNPNNVEKILWKMCPYLGLKGTKIITEVMRECGCNIHDALGFTLELCAENSVNWFKNFKVTEKFKAMLAHKYRRIVKEETENGLIRLFRIFDKYMDEPRAMIDELIKVYKANVGFMIKGNDKARNLYGIMSYIDDLVKISGLENVIQFLNLSEQYESQKSIIDLEKVTLTTMHGAKGKEWKYVVILCDDNISVPSFEGIATMLKKKVKITDISRSIDENRRLHYVAFTRAKKELALIADFDNISLYTLEALGIVEKVVEENMHIIDMAMEGVSQEVRQKSDEILRGEGSIYRYDIKELLNVI